MRRLVASLAASLLAAALTILVAPTASASCAVPPMDSPYAFTGTVVEVSDGGREATVRRDDGRTVTVRGSESPGAITSVDRTYAVGARYEFHPLNGSEPYRDNLCTATRQLSGPAPAAPAAENDSSLPSWLPYDPQSGVVSWVAAAGVLIGVLAVGVVGVRWATRRAVRSRPAPR